MNGRLPVVAVVGRPNVGKSSLVNRLSGRKQAIEHETPGVTRDRVEVPARWEGIAFTLVDTGGIPGNPRGIEESVARQAMRAMESADLILLVLDVTTGITDEDERLVRRLRGTSRPLLVVANKVDSDHLEPLAAELNALGFGEPLAVSALHGRGSGELLDRIVDLLPKPDEAAVEVEIGRPIRSCIVGRPNVGKSSLFNRLVREERSVVHEEAGTTRDAVDSIVEVEGRTVRFVDTAGLRRMVKTQDVEFYGLLRSFRAIAASEVAILVVDASEGLTGDDLRIAARVAEEGRGLVAVLNKWDLVPSEERAAHFLDMKAKLEVFPGTPVVRISALTGRGVDRVARALFAVHEGWTRRVPTSEVNKVLGDAFAAHRAPRGEGRVLYGTQVSAGPPSFVLFGTGDPGRTYRRYLENVLRRAFGFDGVPIRISFRSKRRRGSERVEARRRTPSAPETNRASDRP